VALVDGVVELVEPLVEFLVVPMEEAVEAMEGGMVAVLEVEAEVMVDLVLMWRSLKTPLLSL
jgi:hypothetical protein